VGAEAPARWRLGYGGREEATQRAWVYFQLRRLLRLSTYSRPLKYPAARMAITISIIKDAGRVLRVPICATITTIIAEHMGNGDRFPLSWISDPHASR
jgi:hypothetical protein